MSRLHSSPRLRAALFGLLPTIVLAAGSPEARKAIAYLAPVLILLVALLAERYPGESLISRSRAAASKRREPPPLLSVALAEPRARRGPLLAFAEAGRAPPGFAKAIESFMTRLRRSQMLKRTALFCVTAVALLLPAAAQAHVSVHPNTVPEGAFATLNVRVPGEEENAYAYKVATLLPAGFTDVSIQNVPDWTAKVVTKKLAKPIQTDDGPVSEEVSQVIWTGDKSVNGRLDNGRFMQFPLSIAMPEKIAGKSLAFKTLEYYSNGKVIHWIGAPNAEFPAPTVNITAKGGVLQDVAGGEAGPAAGEVPGEESGSATTSSSSSASGASKGLGIAALVVGALGLLLGGIALLRTQRKPRDR